MKTWLEANAYCLEQNSNLMSIQDIHQRVKAHTSIWKQALGEKRFYYYFLKFQLWIRTPVSAEVFWIGLNDRVTEGIWEWNDGTAYIQYLSYVNLILRQCKKKRYFHSHVHECRTVADELVFQFLDAGPAR